MVTFPYANTPFKNRNKSSLYPIPRREREWTVEVLFVWLLLYCRDCCALSLLVQKGCNYHLAFVSETSFPFVKILYFFWNSQNNPVIYRKQLICTSDRQLNICIFIKVSLCFMCDFRSVLFMILRFQCYWTYLIHIFYSFWNFYESGNIKEV